MALVERLRILEWAIEYGESACEVHQILVTDIMHMVVLDSQVWVEQLLKVGSEDLWQHLVKSRVVCANQSKLRRNRCVLVLLLNGLVAVEVHVDDCVSSVTSLYTVDVVEY